MTAECAICYVCDINYLLPSIVSAITMRKFVQKDRADVILFVVDADDEVLREINKTIEKWDMVALKMESDLYAGPHMQHFPPGSVSPATLGRFFIDPALPKSTTQILYIDGDTWIKSDPSALILAKPADGMLAAAEDMISLRYDGVTPRGKIFGPYLKSLGINPKKTGYFNAGVLSVRRATWKALAAEAWDFYVKNVEICKYNDQSALNAIIGDRRLFLSLKWNFQTPLRYLNLEQSLNPRVYHFHSYPKPWMAECAPWTEFFSEYQKLFALLATLNLPVKYVSQGEADSYNRLNWRKNALLKIPGVAAAAKFHMGISKVEAKAWM